MSVKTVGLDLAKDVFQVHGISENGRVIFNKAIKRANQQMQAEGKAQKLKGDAQHASGEIKGALGDRI